MEFPKTVESFLVFAGPELSHEYNAFRYRVCTSQSACSGSTKQHDKLFVLRFDILALRLH